MFHEYDRCVMLKKLCRLDVHVQIISLFVGLVYPEISLVGQIEKDKMQILRLTLGIWAYYCISDVHS